MPERSSPATSRRKTDKIPDPHDSSSQEAYWEAVEILDQKGDQFLVSWAGTNPETGKQWEPTWVRLTTDYRLMIGKTKELYTGAP